MPHLSELLLAYLQASVVLVLIENGTHPLSCGSGMLFWRGWFESAAPHPLPLGPQSTANNRQLPGLQSHASFQFYPYILVPSVLFQSQKCCQLWLSGAPVFCALWVCVNIHHIGSSCFTSSCGASPGGFLSNSPPSLYLLHCSPHCFSLAL